MARIKGQEVEIRFIKGGEIVQSFTNVRTFEFESQLDLLREGYLGESTDRRDDVYRGVRGRATLHFEDGNVYKIIRDIVDRARRRLPSFKVNAVASCLFPNGDVARIVIQDIKFGAFPVTFGGRAEYGEITVDFEAEDWKLIS